VWCGWLVPAVLEDRYIGEAVKLGEPRVEVGGYRLEQHTVAGIGTPIAGVVGHLSVSQE
jgi:hypothetical protein